jgi:MurNAc alpha-1-phosphate uridylyltransferase
MAPPLRALLFAAGRGERLRPLTDQLPKPLLPAGGRPLIEWQIAGLVRAGIVDIVINTAHRGSDLVAALGDGSRLGARIAWSHEGPRAADALETAGGIVHALPLLGEAPFIAASGDLVTDFPYGTLVAAAARIQAGHCDAHLVLVDNPPYHPRGDMGLEGGLATRRPPLLNYGNIGVFAPHLFRRLGAGRLRLFPWLYAWVDAERVGAEYFGGRWYNVGTSTDLEEVDRALRGA